MGIPDFIECDRNTEDGVEDFESSVREGSMGCGG